MAGELPVSDHRHTKITLTAFGVEEKWVRKYRGKRTGLSFSALSGMSWRQAPLGVIRHLRTKTL